MRSFSARAFSRVIVALAAAALVATACAPAGPPTGAPADQPKPGGRVIVGSFADAKVLNPVLSTDVPSSEVHSKLYEALLRFDPNTGEPKPNFAASFDVSADSKTYTFTLKDGVVWSDGSAFSGEDFKFTVQAVMRSKATVRKNIFEDIVGAKDYGAGKAEDIAGVKVEGSKITVEFTKAFCPALTNVAGFGVIPKSVFGKYLDPKDATKNLDQAAENTKPTISTGAFVFKEWIPNDHITLVRNEKYHRGAPLLQEWVFKVVPDATALAAALKTGEADVGSVEAKDRDDLKAAGNLNLFTVPGRGYTYIGWNQLRGGKELIFQSKNVRQALTYGLNMDAVIEKILLGEGKKQVGHSVPVYWTYDPAGLKDYKFDPKKAEELIQADGWTKGADGIYAKGGQKLEFSIVTNSGNKTRETLLQVAVEQYKAIGVSVQAKTESFEALVDRLTKSKDAKYGEQGGHDYDAVIIGWSLGFDPDAYSIWHSSQIKGGFDFVGYKNDAIDKALEDGRTLCQRDQRKAAYKVFDTELNENQPYNFGFSQNSLIFVNKKFQGVAPGPFGGTTGAGLSMWNIEKWWVKE